ncbi:hypothetical protein EYF80_066658 [Liparis tanakae]|uniref:Uncharacterized protein n=1 Tax=Liparis tanakae TaxID=230148 RepID=A0A4Z2E4F6_9TELE|nr:hypothetical protein EYF80_066658 [Liparis tanakae]
MSFWLSSRYPIGSETMTSTMSGQTTSSTVPSRTRIRSDKLLFWTSICTGDTCPLKPPTPKTRTTRPGPQDQDHKTRTTHRTVWVQGAPLSVLLLPGTAARCAAMETVTASQTQECKRVDSERSAVPAENKSTVVYA